MWSVVTIVPGGYREFCYNVDGKFAVSKKHPTNSDGSCNWRTVYGPPSGRHRPRDRRDKQHWFVELAVNIADAMQRILPLQLNYDQSDDSSCDDEVAPLLRRGRRSSRGLAVPHLADVEEANTRVREFGATRRKLNASWLDRPLQIAICSVAAYATITLLYVVWNYLLNVS